ncbi:hypothetical protein SISNIDRAFT_483907 [Sistotremastrum niveocremeum HHB9708]|uniref:MYND-type domain-containing protein n=1 Tax=Sistotremastrum niveocremeum HHB9708 TaxID=1314777 RepID=A0A164X6U3_9AGAM|nr:hypothetical protein SISNIDRAFT_483907 [Sistotremastrum niveocremeum HHB9708]
MSELAKILDAEKLRSGPAFTFDALSRIVCRYLGISIFTNKDLKRLIRKDEGSEAIRKLLQCAEANMRDARVLCGVLGTFARLLQDGSFGQELLKQNLPQFLFRCLDLDSSRDFDVYSDPEEHRRLVVFTILEMSRATADYGSYFAQAFEGTAKIARGIDQYSDNLNLLQPQLKILHRYLADLSGYKVMHQQPLPSASLEGLELPALARSMLKLLSDPTPSVLLWKSLDSISEILGWIAYYQSSAILDLPNDDGISVFVAFMLSASLQIRARGIMGLLNVYYNDTAQEVRLCNPQYILHLGQIPTPDRIFLGLSPSPMFVRCISRFLDSEELARYYFPESGGAFSTATPPDGAPFDAYETALRVVYFELNGPQNNEESFHYPESRLLGSADLTPVFWNRMEDALRSHEMDYEADILNFVPLLVCQRSLINGDKDNGAVNFCNSIIKRAAIAALKRWPESSYFQYMRIRSQTGAEYLELADEQQACEDCTPYLRSQLALEAALNQFSMGIVRLCVDADARRLRTPLSGEDHMNSAASRIYIALRLANPGSADEKILTILSVLTTLVIRLPELDRRKIESLKEDIYEAIQCILKAQYSRHIPLLRLAVAFLVHSDRDGAPKRWSSLLEAIKRDEPKASQERQIGGLVETLKFCDIDDSLEEVDGIPQSLLKAAGYGQRHRCSCCGRASLGLRKCARCGKAKYCDKECQQRHWKAGHKSESVFKDKDLKRLIKKDEGADAVRKLLRCGEENIRDARIVTGVLMTFRILLKDGILSQEISKQSTFFAVFSVRLLEIHADLRHFLFRCLELDPRRDFDVRPLEHKFRRLTIETIFDLAWAAPTYESLFDQAFQGTAKITNGIHQYSDDPEVLLPQLKILHRYLSKLNAYKTLTQQALPPTILQGLELPKLARIMLQFLEDPTPTTALWESLDSITEILCWIPYFQSTAILDLPNEDGIKLFVALMLSSSMPIRARGLMGLLNLYHNDTAQETRLCNPQYITYLGRIVAPDRLISRVEPPPFFMRCMNRFHMEEPTEESFAERDHNPSTTTLPDGSRFEAYEAALRVVDFEFNGPRNNEESFHWPIHRLLGAAEFSSEVWDDMEAALRFHEKHYEADVLNFVPMLIAQRLLLTEDEDDGLINAYSHILRHTAVMAAKRWPESCFFQYASIQSLTGTQHLESVDQHSDCASCTPYLRLRFSLEAAFNEFSMGIVRLCVDADAARLQSQISGEEQMRGAVGRISVALGLSNPGSAEEKILTILSALAAIVTKMPSLSSSEIQALRNDMRTAVDCLIEKKYTQPEPLIKAVSAFIVNMDAASQRWRPFLDAVQKTEVTAREDRYFGALIEQLKLFDKDEPCVDEAHLSPALLKAVGYRQQHRCTTCGRGSLGLRKCARCGKAKYCDKECQQRHWKASDSVAWGSDTAHVLIHEPHLSIRGFKDTQARSQIHAHLTALLDMNELTRILNAIEIQYFTLEDLSKIVCRHLGLAASTDRDIKHIIKRDAGAEATRKLLECAAENMRDGRVLGGILKTFRRLLKDGVLGQEIARQNLLHLAFQCLELDFDHDFDVHPDPTQFHELITDTIYDLSWAAAEYKTIFDQAFEGTAKIARALNRCTDDPEILLTQLKILQRYLSKLNAYKVLNQEPLPSSNLQSLELPMLTRKLMELVDNPSSPESLWESLEFIAEIFSWIAYYQSSAILDIPDNEGVSLFTAFMLSSSMPIRASGVMGLLNLYHNDTAQEIRLCNPQHILHLGKIETPDQLILKLTPPPLFLRCMSKFIHAELGNTPIHEIQNDETMTLPDGFDPYETALRVVDFELNGPRSSDESFIYPKDRILGTAQHTPEVWDAMEEALRSHDKEYEIDVLNFSFLLLSRRILHFGESDGGAINVLNATNQGAARSQIGAEYVARVDEQVDRASCTPNLRSQLAFEASLNTFSMGIVRLCVDADAIRLRSQIFGEEYMKEAGERIATALEHSRPGSAEEQILTILAALTTLVN